MEDWYYRVYGEDGTKRCFYRRRDAYEYYQRSGGIRIETVTKDLFPTIKVVIDEPDFNLERIREDLSVKETTEALRKAVEKYDRENTIQIKIKLNQKTDKDIIEYLGTLSNKQGFIKELIREYLEKGRHY